MANKYRKKKRKLPRENSGTKFLDSFSEKDIHQWQQHLEALETYWVKIHYHLEGLRALHSNEITQSLQKTTPITVDFMKWTRIVDWRFSNDPLSAYGSLLKGGRFNIGTDINSGLFAPFPALYCAENYETAYAERFGASPNSTNTRLSGHELALRDDSSFTRIRVKGTIHNVFDLNKTANLKRFVDIIKTFDVPLEIQELGRSVNILPPWIVSLPSELKKVLLQHNWREWPTLYDIPSSSQIFARLIEAAGFEGILYPSTKGNNNCISIYLRNLDGSDSYVELCDKPPTSVKHTKLYSENWRSLR